jgi:hypothetical protein
MIAKMFLGYLVVIYLIYAIGGAYIATTTVGTALWFSGNADLGNAIAPTWFQIMGALLAVPMALLVIVGGSVGFGIAAKYAIDQFRDTPEEKMKRKRDYQPAHNLEEPLSDHEHFTEVTYAQNRHY